MAIPYSDMIRNKDLLSFNEKADILLLCPDCDHKLTRENLIEGYDTIAKCPSCGLRIYVGN